jgi:hypothetical protein
MTGSLDALRGGTYVVSEQRVRFVGARVVSDARADGTFDVGSGSARVRLRGNGVAHADLTLTATRATGTVAGRRVDLRIS